MKFKWTKFASSLAVVAMLIGLGACDKHGSEGAGSAASAPASAASGG